MKDYSNIFKEMHLKTDKENNYGKKKRKNF